MLKKLDNLDKRYSKKIFKLEFPTLINLIFYGFSILYMEETVFFTIASFYYFIIKNLRLTAYYIIVLGLNVFVTVFMKRIFNRTRPSDKELSKSNKTTFLGKSNVMEACLQEILYRVSRLVHLHGFILVGRFLFFLS